MISFGPFSFDGQVEAGTPAGPIDPAVLGAPGAGLFDSVLDQLMGDDAGANGLELSIDTPGSGRDDDAEPSLDREDAPSIDPTELVNALSVIAMPMTIASAAPVAVAASEQSPSLDTAPETAAPETVPANDHSGKIQSAEGRAQAFDALNASETPDTSNTAPAPPPARSSERTDPALVKDLAPAADIVADQASPRPADNQRVKPQPTQRSVKAERVRAELPRIDPAAVRPMAITAVEKAYTSADREPSWSFDRPRETTLPAPRLQAIGEPVSALPFVVAPEARGVTVAAPVMALASGSPQSIEHTIETHVPQQIVQSIRMQAIDGGGEAIVRLRPEFLGEVVVAVKVEHGAVTAALQADTPAVRQWVERNEPVLRQALAEHGLQLERLTVTDKATDTSADRETDHQDRREQPSRQQPRRRRQQPDDATFEVTA